MKKVIIASILLMSAVFVRAENPIIEVVEDPIIEPTVVGTLLDHVMVVTQFRSGETRLALLDSVVQIGKMDGKSILDLQLGFNTDVAPKPGEVSGADFLAGGFLKVSTLLYKSIKYPEHWEFLRAIEHGGFINYDFREKEWYGGYQCGFSFELNPKS